MRRTDVQLQNRRKFLAFLAASPLLRGQTPPDPIADPKEAINVMDFEAVAQKALPPAHFGFMATGVDDDATLKANRDGFNRFYLRPRRLVNITRADLRTEVFGATWNTPIALAPVGHQKAFHADGEVAVARAARARSTMKILSTMTTCPLADVNTALGQPVWYQLYSTSRWEVTEKLVHTVEDAGCPVLVFTVDLMAGRHTETLERFRRMDKRQCAVCHGTTSQERWRHHPMFNGIDVNGLGQNNPALTWEHVERMKKLSKMKLVLKGIETREDARMCLESGVDGIIISNHGGRATESGRGTIECLPEVIEAVGGKIPVLIDGGFRRGTDIYKALALGARAVCIGRPYIWGLAGFGQAGVERVLDLLRAELELVMRQCGTPTIAQIGPSSVGIRDRRM